MEQRDYLLREIEKIGLLLRALISRLIGFTNSSDDTSRQIMETKELLLSETNFDVDSFLRMDETETKKYLSSFNGLNVENMELLAEFLVVQSNSANGLDRKKLLKKALNILVFCRETDKTFNMERETRIENIENSLRDF
jgi:hypothetical protein